jgi:hypothetical protein
MNDDYEYDRLFMSPACQKKWDEMPDAVRRAAYALLKQNIRENQKKLMEEFLKK